MYRLRRRVSAGDRGKPRCHESNRDRRGRRGPCGRVARDAAHRPDHQARTPGPAIFKQTRIGRNCKPFTLYKFRTLYADARERFPELYNYDYSPDQIETLQFKTADDPRVTPQGKRLRMSTLDELPNLWNVLKGEMALVGPRPEIPEMLPYYHGELIEKFSVRPGVTGLAQISGRGRLKFLETAALDLEYVRTRSIRTDAKIVCLTILKVVLRDGAF